jgi:hypothetical protein
MAIEGRAPQKQRAAAGGDEERQRQREAGGVGTHVMVSYEWSCQVSSRRR